MFQLDTDTSRRLVREHQARLTQDWQPADPARAVVVASRRRHGRFRLSWLRTQLRPVSHTP